jgi:hypothetical protein
MCVAECERVGGVGVHIAAGERFLVVEVDCAVDFDDDVAVVRERQEIDAQEVGADRACGLDGERTFPLGRLCL